jgi:hypothetical protein
VGDRRDLRARDFQLFDPEQRLLVLAHQAAAVVDDGTQEHVRTSVVPSRLLNLARSRKLRAPELQVNQAHATIRRNSNRRLT